jgi:REP element-mobilizing transposase RayT
MIRERFYENTTGYFVTFNIVDWVDLFIRPVYKQIVVHTLNHFVEHRGLSVFAWCLMTNHLHVLGQARGGYSMGEMENEFKTFTTQKILEAINVEPDIRREWMLERFEKTCQAMSNTKKFQLWQQSSNPIYIDLKKTKILIEYIQYIHENPVRNRIVTAAEDYLYSSARDYAGMRGLVNIIKLPLVERQFSVVENVNGNFFGKYIRN